MDLRALHDLMRIEHRIEGAAEQMRVLPPKQSIKTIFMKSSCTHGECELASYREATPGRCLGVFRWRGGPGSDSRERGGWGGTPSDCKILDCKE